MESFGHFPPRGGFHGRNFRGCAMRRHCGRPYDCFNEFMFPMDHPFAFSRWNSPRGMGSRGAWFRRHMEGHERLNEYHQKEKQSPTDEVTATKANPEDETTDNTFRTSANTDETCSFFDKFSSFLKIFDEDGPFEVVVNLRGCDPDNVKVNIINNVLKVEGRSENPDGDFTSVRHEQSIPKEVPVNSLKASLYPEGILTVRQEESSVNIPVHIEENEGDAAEENFVEVEHILVNRQH